MSVFSRKVMRLFGGCPHQLGLFRKNFKAALCEYKLRPLARAEFPDDIIVTGKNMKHYPGKTKGVSAEPDLMVVDAQTGQVKKVYEAARTEADGVTFKLRERNKETKYQGIDLPYHFEPVR